MEGILGLAIIVGLWYLISYIYEKVEDTKIDIKKSKKNKEDRALEHKRVSLNIYVPKTQEKFYPILLLPMHREVYHFGEGLYWIKPEFNSYENYNIDMYGASERRYYQTLIKYFGNERVKNNELSIKINKDIYLPDFTYIDNERKIFIDIEIDEPYSFKTNKPIHYQYADNHRNQYLQRGGWAVIRFTEKQVIQQPDECCKFIASYLAYAYMDRNKVLQFNNIGDVRPDKTWSKSEAELHSLTNYRKSY